LSIENFVTFSNVFLKDELEPIFVIVSEKEKTTTAQPILSDGERAAMKDDFGWEVEQVVLHEE